MKDLYTQSGGLRLLAHEGSFEQKTNMAANAAEGLEWRQARQYLISSGVIPPTHRVTKPDVDLVDFARSLRDGVFLCSLLNKMKPDCVEDWSPKPLMQVRTVAVLIVVRVVPLECVL